MDLKVKPSSPEERRAGAERLRAQMAALNGLKAGGLARMTGFRLDRVEEWLAGAIEIPAYVTELLDTLIESTEGRTIISAALKLFPPDRANDIVGAHVRNCRRASAAEAEVWERQALAAEAAAQEEELTELQRLARQPHRRSMAAAKRAG